MPSGCVDFYHKTFTLLGAISMTSILPFKESEMGRALTTIELSLTAIQYLLQTELSGEELKKSIEKLAAESSASVKVLYASIDNRSYETQTMLEEFRCALKRVAEVQEQARAMQENATSALNALSSWVDFDSKRIY
jgi:hypothetical protein